MGFFFHPTTFLSNKGCHFVLFVRQKLSNALKSLKSKKVYRNRPIERVSECHSPHHIYNSLLRMRSIHELIKERDLAKLQVLLNINFMMKTLALVSALVNVQQNFFPQTVHICFQKQNRKMFHDVSRINHAHELQNILLAISVIVLVLRA